jgi:hypothetical protein
MSTPRADGWTRRHFLGGLTLTGTMGVTHGQSLLDIGGEFRRLT